MKLVKEIWEFITETWWIFLIVLFISTMFVLNIYAAFQCGWASFLFGNKTFWAFLLGYC